MYSFGISFGMSKNKDLIIWMRFYKFDNIIYFLFMFYGKISMVDFIYGHSLTYLDEFIGRNMIFNNCLHTTDVLWTKPSELSFYCALGIPIIMTPAIGPQEKCNQRWLIDIGAGIKQRNPEYTDQWLYDLLKNGRLAEAAWNGFLKARKYGSFNILEFLGKGHFQFSNDPLKR